MEHAEGPAARRVKTRLFAHMLMTLLVAGCEGAKLATPEPPDPLFLNAASQDRALFLTWNADPNSRRVTLHWRRLGSDAWQDAEGDASACYFVGDLENDVTYECYAERELKTGEKIASGRIAQTPRVRQFEWGLLFTSQKAADDWLKGSGTDTHSLTLRGRPVHTWGPGVPDGVYTAADGRFLFTLLRSADDRFHPPLAPRSPEQVRTILKHALWPKFNPFNHPRRFPMPIAPIEPAIVGNVRRFASASSFAISYHPQLSSRCTRFMPITPSPGKVAIYLDGHRGHTVIYGADLIERLLERGWQVIAVDMPLVGANAPDVSRTLRTHNDFFRMQAEDFCPVSLFLQPLKALVDQIYRDNASTRNLTVMLIGRSGGGWTSFMYGAVDTRIHYVVSVAGGVPLSQRLGEVPADVGDYEQFEPQVYDAVPVEDTMIAAGARGAFYVYNEHDPCCFRLHPGEPFVRYLEDVSLALNKPIGVFVDTANRSHSFSDAAFAELDKFLERMAERSGEGARIGRSSPSR